MKNERGVASREMREAAEQPEQEVKSAMEIALERAGDMKDELLTIETEEGPVSLTFDEIKAKATAADEYLSQLQYKQAEFENFRRRKEKEREELLSETVQVADLLGVLDHLDRALASEGDAELILEGVSLIRDQLWTLLERKGVEHIPAHRNVFDPKIHEAVAKNPHAEVPEGDIAEEYQPGYRIGEKVLRPSKVVVSAGPA